MNQFLCDPDEHPRVIELPFRFGQIVYHAVATERCPGIIFGFVVVIGCPVKVLVKWGDKREQDEHFPIELTTEYEPLFPGS